MTTPPPYPSRSLAISPKLARTKQSVSSDDLLMQTTRSRVGDLDDESHESSVVAVVRERRPRAGD